MLDNFAVQPYPLECSADGKAWALVIGWQRAAAVGALTPVIAVPGSGAVPATDPSGLRYRVAAGGSAPLPEDRAGVAPDAVRRDAKAAKAAPS